MHVFFAHGLESGLTGKKVTVLQKAGFVANGPNLQCHPKDVLFCDRFAQKYVLRIIIVSLCVVIATVCFFAHNVLPMLMYSRLVFTFLLYWRACIYVRSTIVRHVFLKSVAIMEKVYMQN